MLAGFKLAGEMGNREGKEDIERGKKKRQME